MRANVLLLMAAQCIVAAAQGAYEPWGIHMAYGDDPLTSMTFVYSTRAPTQQTQLNLGLSSGANTWLFSGSQTQFTDLSNTQYIHKVYVTGLNSSTSYYYSVGDGIGNVSAVFSFKTAAPDAHPVFAVYGDMGTSNNSDATRALIAEDVMDGVVDVILHHGDLAYDLNSNAGATGDLFVQQIQPIAAFAPYHTCPGNHESADDFFQYNNRFDLMPGGSNATHNSNFHSFNLGQVHVVMFSSEAYFWVSDHGLLMLPDQYAWLENDLTSVDRTVTPWIIVLAHRPMYCSPNDDDDDCHSVNSLVRDGIFGQYGVEVLLYKYGVDVFFGAHEHSYERNYPVYRFQYNANVTGQAAYVDYDRPIHILSGAAGCPEDQDPWQKVGNNFSAVRINAYGYGRLHALNSTHLFWEFVDNSDGIVVDSVYFIRHQHGPFTAASGHDLDATPAHVVEEARKPARKHSRLHRKNQGHHENSFGNRAHGHTHDPAQYQHHVTPEFLTQAIRANGW